jgi:hypothetical protein
MLLATPIYCLEKNSYFLLGDCFLPLDPDKDQDKIDSSFFICLKGSAFVDGVYVPNKSYGLSDRLSFKGSAHYGSNHAFFYNIYYEQFDSTSASELQTHNKNHAVDLAAYQFGNSSRDQFRFILGQQNPAFGINHFPEIGFQKLLNPRYIWGPARPGITFVLDSQIQTQIELGWIDSSEFDIHLKKTKEYSVTTRISHDFSLAGNTRSVFSALFNKNGEKRLSLGFINIGPHQNSFQAEWVRIYSSLGSITDIAKGSEQGLNSTYTQLIRLLYEDPPEQPVRTSILFDDLAFQYRLFTFGVSLETKIHTIFRFSIGFKQDLTEKKRHRWLFGSGFGVQL